VLVSIFALSYTVEIFTTKASLVTHACPCPLTANKSASSPGLKNDTGYNSELSKAAVGTCGPRAHLMWPNVKIFISLFLLDLRIKVKKRCWIAGIRKKHAQLILGCIFNHKIGF